MQAMEYVTNNPNADEQMLYFTTSSLSQDDKLLFFLSNGGGNPNIWVRNLDTGDTHMISDNHDGVLKSYVYFLGKPYVGLGKASISLDSKRKIVYYLQGKEVMAADEHGMRRKVAELPQGYMTAFTHISADGKYLCIPMTDERALEDESCQPYTPDGCGDLPHNIDTRVQVEKLSSYLNVFDIETGEQVACEKVPLAWITHVQFSPIDSSVILYNHEWPAQCGIRRMWLFKKGKHLRLRCADHMHHEDDWTCHEMWMPDGNRIVYHGGYDKGGFYLGLVGKDYRLTEYCLPPKYKAYGHFTMGNQDSSLLVTDGYYTDDDGQHDYISTVHMDWNTGNMKWTPLCHHDSNWVTQDRHPHPIFDHHDRYVYFTGHKNGILKVCRTAVQR